MKNLTLYSVLIGLLFCALPGSAQITLEQVYPDGKLKLFMVNLEYSGQKYVKKSMDTGNRYMHFYNLDHSFWKSINVDPFPIMAYCGPPTPTGAYDALYISESVFDCDGKIEFLYFSYSDCKWYSAVYNEDGDILLEADSCSPLVYVNIPQQYRPIYNTPNGTKLILSHKNGTASVYSLPCTLSEDIDLLTIDPSEDTNLSLSVSPGFYDTKVQYTLPEGIDQGEIIITNEVGSVISQYIVDNTFSDVLISKRDIGPGTYHYQLMDGDKVLVAKTVVFTN